MQPIEHDTPDEDTLIRQRRSFSLNPDFGEHPYSVEWAFSLPTAFRAALDIRWTALQKNKVKFYRWTQGENFAFSPGDVIYDTIKGYLNWPEALREITTCITVLSASPGTAADDFQAQLEFLVQHPTPEKTALTVGTKYSGSQLSFVRLLEFGIWNDTHHSKL